MVQMSQRIVLFLRRYFLALAFWWAFSLFVAPVVWAEPTPSKSRSSTATTLPVKKAKPQKKGSHLLAVAQFHRIDALLQAARTFSKHKLLRGLDFSRMDSIVSFLKGSGGKVMGLQWNQGLWLALSTTSPILSEDSKGWYGNYIGDWLWERWLRLPNEVEFTIKVPLRGSFFIRLGLQRFLKFASVDFSTRSFDNQTSLWLRFPRRWIGVIVIQRKAILVRILRAPRFQNNEQQHAFWKQRIFPMTKLFRSRALRHVEQRLSAQFTNLFQWRAYVWPFALSESMGYLGFSKPMQWRTFLREVDGVGVGGWFRGMEVRGKEILWMRQPQRIPKDPKAPNLSMLAPSGVQLLADVAFPPRKTWLSHRGRWALSKRFRQEFQTALRRLWSEQKWEQGGGFLWRDSWLEWTLVGLFGNNFSFGYVPQSTASPKKPLPQGIPKKQTKEKLVLLGQWNPQHAGGLIAVLSRMPSVTRFDLYGTTPYFVLWQDAKTKAVFSWRGKTWILSQDFAQFHELYEKIGPKTPKSQGLRQFSSESLVHLRAWGRQWQVLHLKPSKLSCCWMSCRLNRLMWSLVQRLEVVELATTTRQRIRQLSVRVRWNPQPRRKELFPSCQSKTPMGAGVWLQMWSPFADSAAGRVIRQLLANESPLRMLERRR